MAVVPKFIQSSYYELFLAELFPLTAEQGDKEKDSDSRGGALIASLEAIRHNPEAVAERIAEAVAAAKAAAEAEAIAAAEAEEAAKLAARAEGVEGNRQQADGEVRVRRHRPRAGTCAVNKRGDTRIAHFVVGT